MAEDERNNHVKPTVNILIEELAGKLDNPAHKRLLKAYNCANPLDSMEKELNIILSETIHHES